MRVLLSAIAVAICLSGCAALPIVAVPLVEAGAAGVTKGAIEALEQRPAQR